MTARQLVWIGVATTTVGSILTTVILSVVGHLGDVVRWIAGTAVDVWNFVWAVLPAGVPLWLLVVAGLAYVFIRRMRARLKVAPRNDWAAQYKGSTVAGDGHLRTESEPERLWNEPPEGEPAGRIDYRPGYGGTNARDLRPSELQGRILVLLARADGRQLAYDELARDSLSTQLRISQAVDQLEEAKLVVKYDHYDPSRVELSSGGRDFVIRHGLDSFGDH